jgi:cytochrome c553
MRYVLVLACACAVALAGCKKTEEEPPSESPGPTEASGSAAASNSAAAFEARHTFQTICATCHGPDGKGNGQAAAALNPKPRNYTDKAWQASVTDDDIRKIILGGGAAVGKSPVMPAQVQLRDKPEVVDELVKIVRGFGK